MDASHPVKTGDMIQIYCTGLGATNPPVPTGQAAQLASVTTPVSVTVGGVNALPVQYAGLAPGFVNLYQVNVSIPSGVALGAAVSVVITQNGVPSNTVTIALR